jgi:hypothetical protein
MSEPRIPRREERHLLPFSSVVLKVELIANGFSHHGYLWDVTSCGACLCLRDDDDQQLSVGQEALIRFLSPERDDPERDESLSSRCWIIWLNSIHGACFAGVELDQTLDLTSTFFHHLLHPRYLHEASPN